MPINVLQVAYPLEAHGVFFNSKYGKNLSEALINGAGEYDTLAVVGVLHELSGGEDNAMMANIVEKGNIYNALRPM